MSSKNDHVKDWPRADNEMKLRRKHLSKPPPKKTKSKGDGNKGNVGRVARAEKRAVCVSQRNSPEQWLQFKQWADKAGYLIRG